MDKDDQNNRKRLFRQFSFRKRSHEEKEPRKQNDDEEKEPQKRSDDEEKERNRTEQIGVVGDEKDEPQRFQDSNKGGIPGDSKGTGESSSMTQIGVPTQKSTNEGAEDKDDGGQDSRSETPVEFLIPSPLEESHVPVPIQQKKRVFVTEKLIGERAEDSRPKMPMEYLKNHIQEMGMGGTNSKFLIERPDEESHLLSVHGVEDSRSKMPMEYLNNHIQEMGIGGTNLESLIERTREDGHLLVPIVTEEERMFLEEAKQVEVVGPSLQSTRITIKKWKKSRMTWTNVSLREGGEGGGGGEGNNNGDRASTTGGTTMDPATMLHSGKEEEGLQIIPSIFHNP